MRILMCCEFYPPSVGGVQRVMQEVAENLVQRGHAVTVTTTWLPERSFKELNGVNVREFKISGNRVMGLNGELDGYRRLVVSGGFDVILINAAQQWAFDALWEVLPQIKARKVHIPCGYSGFYQPRYADYYREMPDILRRFDHLIFHASDYRDINFCRRHHLSRYSIIPNGASRNEFENPPALDFRRQAGLAGDRFIFLSLGSPPFQKGHLEVARAYARLKLPFDSALILNGNYSPREDLRLQPAETRLKVRAQHAVRCLSGRGGHPAVEFEKAVRAARRDPGKQLFISDLPRKELIAAFFASDLFVFASHVDYSPLVLFESAAAGLPFISVPVGNAAEIARWTEGGIICPANTDREGNTRVAPIVLAREMQQLASNRKQLERLSRCGRENWRQRFSWDKIAQRYEEILVGC